MSFEAARADFEAAWCRLSSKITEADFDDYRRNRAWTTWLCAVFDSGCMLPTQVCDGRSRCFCGAVIGLRSMEQHVYTAHYSQDIRFDAFGTTNHI